MIKEETVLVLGAGASILFDFPSGRGLISEICDFFKEDIKSRKLILRNSSSNRFTVEHAESFLSKLLPTPNVSIDEFLRDRPDFWDIGKIGIAAVLLGHEDANIASRVDNNWYGLLFRELRKGALTFKDVLKNKLTIITYNYDRLLEYLLCTHLRDSYDLTDSDCSLIFSKLSKIQIIHLHGKVGDLEYQTSSPYHVRYGMKLSSNKIHRASGQIKIVHENIEENPEFGMAHKALQKAKRIYFLGFGFDDKNLERLLPDSIRHIGKSSKVRGTAWELDTMTKRRAKDLGLEYITDTGTFPNKTIFQYFGDPNFILD